MSLACHAWNSMLNGHFKESQPATSDKQREVALPDDNPDALKILLNISHLRFDLIPSILWYHVFLDVTVLTDKYDATRLIRPWASSWISGVQHLALKLGHEEWLWIAWELGQRHMFNKLTDYLVKTARLHKDGRCLTENHTILDLHQNLPPDILGMHIS
ncbi:hypothetical protein BKA80DRAFT_264620 [Phyllosticta citrichinensis]